MKKYRTWPVFTIGLGSLLLLIFLPGIAALRQSSEIYDEVRTIQHSHERTQSVLFAIERRVLQMSVTVRDFLLDSSPVTTNVYRKQFESLRSSLEDELRALAASAPPDQTGMFDRLSQQLRAYARTVAPVFAWSPTERYEKGTFFLREQQRPRRQSILAIADEIGRLYSENYRTRYEETNASQRRFRDQLKIAIAVAFMLGTAVAGSTILRLSALERQSEHQRVQTERAETEMRSLSARLMGAQEEERRNISRELHDEVGQVLTALRLELGTLDKLRNEVGPRYDQHLAQCKMLSEQTLRTVRELAVGLRPSVLDLGLVAALQWQARHFSRTTQTEAAVRVQGELPPLPDSYLTCVYRIVQEALTNASRHAQAKQVGIAVSATESGLMVTVADDGVGFQKNWEPTRGLGLIGIEERARELGGTVTIESEHGNGVRIHVRLPLPKES
jgi:signal transduction histidine kinase